MNILSSLVRLPVIALVAIGADLAAQPGISVDDCIRFEHIHSLAISRAGDRLAILTYHGDLATLNNAVTLHSLDLDASGRVVARRQLVFQAAVTRPVQNTAIDHLFVQGFRIAADGRTAVFLTGLPGQPRQVYAVDLAKPELRALTNHPDHVREFELSNDGGTLLFASAGATENEAEKARRDWGYSMFSRGYEKEVNMAVMLVADIATARIRDYYVQRIGGEARRVFDTTAWMTGPRVDTGEGAPALSQGPALRFYLGVSGSDLSPDGRHAVIHPLPIPGEIIDLKGYAPVVEMVRRQPTFGGPPRPVVAGYYGLVDLQSGKIEKLLDAPYVFGLGAVEAHWAPDGRSILVSALSPLAGLDEAARKAASAQSPSWREVDVGTRAVREVPLPPGWQVEAWHAEGLELSRGPARALLPRTVAGWGTLQEKPLVKGFNSRRPTVVAGQIVAGVVDDLNTAPEVAIATPAGQIPKTVTDLNPWLRERALARVEKITWPGVSAPEHFGHVLKPFGFVEGQRYPLVILIKDEPADPDDRSFLLDGMEQRIGFAAQVLAAKGFVVLLTPMPALEPFLKVAQRPAEAEMVQGDLRAGLAELARRGWIDPDRVGLSGWSRAGYHANKAALQGFPARAVSMLDGGGVEYLFTPPDIGSREFLDSELGKVQAAILVEACGASFESTGRMATRLDLLDKKVDLYHYPDSHHNLLHPGHRWTSLTNNVDWFRFWLKGEENDDPRHAVRNARWRALRSR